MITVLQLFELAESLVADYEDPELQSWRREFAAMAAKERKGTLLARDVMVAMALEAIGHLYDYADISDAAAPSPGDQTTRGAVMEIQITAVSDNARIIAVKTGGMYAPLAACDPPRSEIIATALELLAARQGDVLRSLLTALPRGGVPLPDTEIHLTREAATTAWTVSTKTVADEPPDTVVLGRHLAAEEVIERVRVAGGRAVVVYRDNNSLHARAERARPSSGLTWSEVMADIDDQTGADS